MKTPDEFNAPITKVDSEQIETEESWNNKLLNHCKEFKNFVVGQQSSDYIAEGRFNSLLSSITNRFSNPKFDIDDATARECLQILREAQELSKGLPVGDKLFTNAIEAAESVAISHKKEVDGTTGSEASEDSEDDQAR